MDKKLRTIYFMFLLLDLLIGFYPAASDAQSDADVNKKQNELEYIKKQLESTQQERARLINKEKSIQTEIELIDKELHLAEKLVLDYNWIFIVTNKKIVRLSAELDTINARLERRQEVMYGRLRNIFMSGKYSFLQVLFSADSFVQLIQRYEFLKLVAKQDYMLYEEIKKDKAEKEAKQAELQQKIAETQQTLSLKKKYEKTVTKKHDDRKKLLTDVQDDRTQHEKRIKELKESARKIENFLASLEKKRKENLLHEKIPDIAKSNHYLAKNKGKIPWPVKGKIIEPYGLKVHPKYKTETFNKGIDISAKKGAGVKAIYQGKVAFADWFSGYGNLVIIDHDGGFYSLYAHLDEIRVSRDQNIQTGVSVGTVGNTGSLEGPALHFELRYKDQTVNPVGWLSR